MSLYYSPPQPHIGAAQPLEGRKLTPPQSGPAPQNPPFLGSRVSQAILSCWAVAAAAVVLPSSMVPQPAAAVPLFKNTNFEIYRAWDALVPAPITTINLDPPLSGPAVNNLPLIGMRIPVAIHIGWIPPPPLPIVAINMDPPIAGPVPQNPPLVGAPVPQAVLLAWQPVPPQPQARLAVYIAPPAAAFPFIGSSIPTPTLAWWVPTPQPQLGQTFYIAPVAPFPFAGARVTREVLQSWEFAPPAAQLSGKVVTLSGPIASAPPLGGGSLIRQSILANWAPPTPSAIVTGRFAIYPVPPVSTVLRLLDIHGAMSPEEFAALSKDH